MLWSRYNHLFRSEGRGRLLYNALSNSFLALPEPFGEKFAELRAGDEFRCDDPGITLQLIAAKAVVDPGEDDRLRDVLRMKRRLADLSERMLLLTVAPTRSCNFACPYCFEANRAGIDMNRETEEQLVRFAERFQPGHIFSVTWFGGEPLLRFGQIRRLSERFRALDFRRYGASLITNGYLLDADKAALLDELAVREVQITLDGPEEVHDRRRTLVSGGGTFRRILENIDALFASGWTGRLLLRVNVDRTNAKEYHRIYEFLYARYSGYAKRLHVYPGIVHAMGKENPDTACLFDVDEAADFQIEQFRRYGVRDHPFYPGRKLFNCIAARRNGYVVGPEGELYKCWNDIGVAERIVGHVDPEKPWNNALLAEWLEGQNALNDPACLSCGLMPVCDGGCPALRREKAPHCSRYRNRLPELLEAHYDATRSGND